jgi:uncharacterized membrane protein
MAGALLEIVLLAATVATGLTAGSLTAFAHTVMPALGTADDAGFVGTFQAIDRAVYNPWFMVPFTLAPLLTGAALLLALADQQGSTVALVVVAAFVLAVATVGVTGAVHLPLNREIGEAELGTGGSALAAARARFERRWVRWNVARSVTATVSFGCLAVALLRVG